MKLNGGPTSSPAGEIKEEPGLTDGQSFHSSAESNHLLINNQRSSLQKVFVEPRFQAVAVIKTHEMDAHWK